MLLFLVLFITTCEELTYEPEKENTVDIKGPVLTDVFIDFSNTTDTLNLWGESILHYNLNPGTKRLDHLDIYIDSNWVSTSESLTEASFSTLQFSNSQHTLRFDIYLHSNNNSLADILGLEIVIINYTKPIRIDNAPPDPVAISEFQASNGMLKIVWPEYKRSNFQEYQVYTNGYKTETINSASTNYYYDPYFVGKPRTYSIVIKAANHVREGITITYSDSMRFISLSANDENRLVFQWEKFKYYTGFESYIIVQGENEVIAEIPTLETTTYIGDKVSFGNELLYHIEVKKSTYDNTIFSTNNLSICLGTKIPSYEGNRVFYDPRTDSYLFNLSAKVVRYDDEFKTRLAESEEQFLHPINYHRASNRLFASSELDQYIFELDPVTLKTVNTISTQEFWTAYTLIVEVPFYIPDDKIIFFGYLYNSPTLYSDKTYLVDIENKIVLDTAYELHDPFYIYTDTGYIVYSTTAYSIIEVSEDGDYVFLSNDSLYDISANTFRKVCGLAQSNFCFYNALNCFIETAGGQIILRNNNDGSIVNQISLNGYNLLYPRVDPITNLLGVIDFNSFNFLVVDMQTSQVVKSIKVIESGYEYWVRIYLLNSRLFSSYGYYLQLDL